MESTVTEARGRNVFPFLAEQFEQLYLRPEADGNAQYRNVVLAGESPSVKHLDHFLGSDEDACVLMQTPAGKVRAVTIHEHADFETALMCIGHKCRITDIPITQGASILDGVISWPLIRSHQKTFLSQGHSEEEWNAEFARFTSDKNNYTEALILLSVGPYSAVAAKDLGKEEDDWIKESDAIRRYHECTHFVARRLYHDQIDPLFDELAADAVGIYAAYGRYDRRIADRVLGLENGAYIGGRLENYVKEPKAQNIPQAAKRVPAVMDRIQKLLADVKTDNPFDVTILIEAHQKQLMEGISFGDIA